MGTQDPDDSVVRERAVGLYKFLREMKKLEAKTVYEVGRYEEVMWLHTVPRAAECGCVLFGEMNGQRQPALLEVHKPRFDRPLAAPGIALPWLSPKADLGDSSSRPELMQPGDGKLDKYPDDLLPVWSDFLSRGWEPWAASDRMRRAVYDTYTGLFSIYQKVERQGDVFDLVVGLGCLSWQTPSGHKVLRHLVTLPVSLRFDTSAGIMQVLPDADSWFSLEQDMLEAAERPPASVQRETEKVLEESAVDAWDGSDLQRLLCGWVNALSPDGQMSAAVEPPGAGSEHPTVHLAPALILRRRTQSAMIAFYDGIIEQLEAGGPVPEGVRRLVEPAEDKKDTLVAPASGELLFPLPANDEQREVARQVMARPGVVVQGPPGTGKSHTIANIVCHLLANGMRVLVTSHTARALRVLQGKLPPGIANLCVPLVGKEMEDHIALQRAVNELHVRADQDDDSAVRRRVAELEGDLRKLREEESLDRRRLRTIREREVYRYDRGSYSGTPEQISRRLREDQARLGWLPLVPDAGAEPPLSNVEAVELLDLLRRRAGVPEDEIARDVGDQSALCSEAEFRQMVDAERAVAVRQEAFSARRQHPAYPALAALSSEQCRAILKAAAEFRRAYERLRNSPEAWVGRAVADVLSGRERTWRELLEYTRSGVASLETLAREVIDYRVDGIAGMDGAVVKAQAIDLLDHLKSGAGMGFGPFRPKVVKEGSFLAKSVRVNGRLCSSVDALRQLVNWIDLSDRLAALRARWAGIAEIQAEASAQAQLADLDALSARLEQVVALAGRTAPIKAIIDECAGCPEPQWYQPADLDSFLGAVEAAVVSRELATAAAPLAELARRYRESVRTVDQHPVVDRVTQAIAGRDAAAFASARNTVIQVLDLRRESARRNDLLAKLRAAAPSVASEVELNPADAVWDSRMSSLVESWDWAKAECWLKHMGDEARQDKPDSESRDVQKRILGCLADIAAARTWDYCARRLTPPLRSALEAWRQAQQRVGKGQGKYTQKWLDEARRCMKECTPAIPAWIMPIQRVCETLKPAPDSFDVVIVDEASQSGPDALLLCYLARKIVVVGDDKQISPTTFTDRGFESELRQKLIPDVPFAELLGVDSSLFDQAQIRYHGRIRLREHFRSMPEIIEFSNRLCYSDQPLIPLRQYGIDRLQPICTTMVADARQEGKTGRVTNPKEADAIVAQVRKCLGSAEYKGKTFGVISLLGADQAKLIEGKLLKAPDVGPEEMDRCKLVCGDAYAFQGDERDVMFLSMVVSAEEGRRMVALTQRSDQQRFNVAASRARDQLWLFHSLGLSDLKNRECVRYRLLEYCLNPWAATPAPSRTDISDLARLARTADRMAEKPPAPFDSWFEVDVFLQVTRRGFRAVPQYSAMGYSLDLVVEGAAHRLAIECDGDYWHGPERYEADLVRQRNLERVGWQFWRVRGSAFYRDPDNSLLALWAALDRLGIRTDRGPSGGAGANVDKLVSVGG